VKAQIDDHPTCMELAVLAVHVPHPSPPEPGPSRVRNAGRSGPRSSPPAGRAARVRPNREAWRQCGRRIGVSSGGVWPGFSSRLPSPSSCCCRTGAPQHSGSAASLSSCDFPASLVSWVLIFVFACALRPVVSVIVSVIAAVLCCPCQCHPPRRPSFFSSLQNSKIL